MVKNFSSKLSAQTGENLVVAELGRRGIIATALAGNVPEIDILAYRDKQSIPIQVKALKKGSLQTNAKNYLNIDFDGKTQTILGKNEDINRDLIFIIVKLGEQLGEDVFYICEQGIIQDLVLQEHSSFLKKHGGIRPRKPSSFGCSIHLKDLEKFEDNWELVDSKFGLKKEGGMRKNAEHNGSCSCGSVKYSINEDPLFTQACHCDDCKKSTGSKFVISSMILESCFKIDEGELDATTLPTGSGSGYKPFFCKKCGTYIYCEYERAPGIILIRTSSLDEAHNFPPKAHVFTKSKVDWIHLDNKIPSFEIWYNRDKLWPQASLDRLSGLF